MQLFAIDIDRVWYTIIVHAEQKGFNFVGKLPAWTFTSSNRIDVPHRIKAFFMTYSREPSPEEMHEALTREPSGYHYHQQPKKKTEVQLKKGPLATQRQISYIKYLGVSFPTGLLTKREASAIIKDAINLNLDR